MPPNFVICYPLSASKIDNEIKNNSCRVRDCNDNWMTSQKKYVINNDKCIDDCKSNNLYEYESKCYSKCPEGTLEHKSMLCKKCNTTTNNCNGCSMLDTDDDLCISCKTGFYEIYNISNINSNAKKCYQSPEGYYLDETLENGPFYKPCFNSCLSCDIEGDEEKHNCLQCKSDYSFEIEYSNHRNCYQKCNYYYYMNITTSKFFCIEELKCPESFSKLIEEKNECVKSCNDNPYYLYYDYRNICYKTCPQGLINNNYSYVCLPKYFESLNNKTQLINNIREYLFNNFDKEEVNSGQDLEIQGEGIFIEITTPQNQILNEINSNKTTINIEACENVLRNNNIIDLNDSLYIMKIDIEQKGMKIPIVEYELYHSVNGEKLQKINISECQNVNIDISIPIKLEHELYKYNASDEYYNNNCLGTTSDSGTDICLKDRRNDFIEQNLTLCEEDCKLIGYNFTSKRAKCNCDIKIELPIIDQVKIDKDKLLKSFTDVKGFFTNIDVVKCYKIVFRIKNLKINLGIFISVLILFFFIICLILFYCKYFNDLKNQIFMIAKAITDKNNHEDNNIKNKFNNIKINIHNVNNNNKIIVGKISNNKKYEKKIKNKNNKNFLNINNSPPIKNKLHFNKNANMKIKNDLLEKKNYNNKKYEKYKKFLEYNDNEMNELSYEGALKYDKRTFFQYYYSLLKIKNIFFFSFLPNNDYNSRIIKIFLFFFCFFTQLTINALYFTDDTMHKIYIDQGKFDFIYQIPQIVFSFLISYVLDSLISYLSLSENDIIQMKEDKKEANKVYDKGKKVISRIKIKFVLFFVFSLIIISTFGFYIACFCGIYKNTQIHLVTDTSISFGLSMLTPFVIELLPSIFRISSLKAKNKNRKYMYKFSTIIETIM